MHGVQRDSSDMEHHVGDEIKCFHGPLVYEAKILKKRKTPSGPQYFVHYKGWKRKLVTYRFAAIIYRWDEWIGVVRIATAEDAKFVSPDLGDEKRDTHGSSENSPQISKKRKFPKNKELCSDYFSSSRIISAFKTLADFDLYSNEHYAVQVFEHEGYLPDSPSLRRFFENLALRFALTKAERKLLNVEAKEQAPVYRLFRTFFICFEYLLKLVILNDFLTNSSITERVDQDLLSEFYKFVVHVCLEFWYRKLKELQNVSSERIS